MRSMTKRCWLSFMPLKGGDTSLKVQSIVLKCGLTTRTWNTSKQPRNSIADSLGGHFTFCIFDFKLQHRPVSTMGKSDALSHCSDHGSGLSDNSNMILLCPELFAVHAMEGFTLLGEECGIVGDIREAFGEEMVKDEVVP